MDEIKPYGYILGGTFYKALQRDDAGFGELYPNQIPVYSLEALAAERERLLNSVTGEPYRILHVHVNEDTGQLHEQFIKPEDAAGAYYDTCKDIIPLFRVDDIAAERERVKKECQQICRDYIASRDPIEIKRIRVAEEIEHRISELKP